MKTSCRHRGTDVGDENQRLDLMRLGPLGDDYWFHWGAREYWQSIDAQAISIYRSKLLQYVHHLKAEGSPVVWSPDLLQSPHQSDNFGIPKSGEIYSSGGGSSLARLRLSLHMLRNVLKSELPVEIYHFTDELVKPGAKEGLLQDFGSDIVLRALPIEKLGTKNWRT